MKYTEKSVQTTKCRRIKAVDVIMNSYMIAVLCVFPLFVTDAYFNILESKYLFFAGASIAMIVLMAICGLVNGSIIKYLKTFKLNEIIKGLTIVDWMIMLFWLANVISWIFCKWPWEAFWGTSGRYNGVFLMTIYMLVYFLVTRFVTLKRWHLDAFLVASMLVCLFGITDFFKMDLLGFKANMLDRQKRLYTSTLGNINTYTIYVAAVMIVSTILFSTEKNWKRLPWYYAAMIISAFALIMGVSDNAYLSLAALFGLTPLYLFKTKTGLVRYLVSVATFGNVLLGVDWINHSYAGPTNRIDSAFTIITQWAELPLIVGGLWVLAIVLTVVLFKTKVGMNYEKVGKWLSRAWIIVIIAVVGAVAFGFYDATVLGHAKKYGALAPYLKFNKKWGTNRGMVWMQSAELFTKIFTPRQKLFGYGADTFGILMQMYYEPSESNGLMVIYDSAHNEYLHYLITIGIFGVCTYIAFLGSSVVKMWKKIAERPEVAALMFAVIAYAVQAVININLPIAMPFTLLMIAMGLGKTSEGKEHE